MQWKLFRSNIINHRQRLSWKCENSGALFKYITYRNKKTLILRNNHSMKRPQLHQYAGYEYSTEPEYVHETARRKKKIYNRTKKKAYIRRQKWNPFRHSVVVYYYKIKIWNIDNVLLMFSRETLKKTRKYGTNSLTLYISTLEYEQKMSTVISLWRLQFQRTVSFFFQWYFFPKNIHS